MNRYKDDEAWVKADADDLWVYDKLILARKSGYVCGPVGVDVPEPDHYIVRPVTNMMGMGVGAKMEFIIDTTDHLPAGYFWCEHFSGDHISVDYIDGKQVLAVVGEKGPGQGLDRWFKWRKVDVKIPYPFVKKYPVLNCEFIGLKLIEAHFRLNPDFQHGDYKALRPVWKDEWDYTYISSEPHGTQFISDVEGERLGFLVQPEDK